MDDARLIATHSPGPVERQLVLIAQQTPLCMAVFDKSMRYLAASDAWIEWHHIDPSNVVGRSHYEIFPDIPPRWVEGQRRALAGEAIRSDLDLVVLPNGSSFWLRWSTTPWRETPEEVSGVVLLAEDVTERRRLKSALESSEAMIRALFETVGLCVAITDGEGRFVRTNAAYRSLVGYPEEELRDMFLGTVLHHEEMLGEMEAIEPIRHGRVAVHESRCRYQRKDGSVTWVDQVISAIPAQDRESMRLVVFCRDAGERVALETRVRETDRLASVGMLGAGLGHDMKSVLFAMRCAVGALQQDAPSAGKVVERDCLEQLGEAIDYLGRLAEGLHLLVVNPEKDDADGATATRLADWWDQTGPLLRKMIARDVALLVELGEDLPAAAISPMALTQAVLNLLVNAGQAIADHVDPARRRGTVTISASRPTGDGLLRLVIGDDGVGMSDDVRCRACEPFFTTRRTKHGTGLGLSMVKRVVESAGGSVEIRSTLGSGTQVVITLPAEGEGGDGITRGTSSSTNPPPSRVIRSPRLRAPRRNASPDEPD